MIFSMFKKYFFQTTALLFFINFFCFCLAAEDYERYFTQGNEAYTQGDSNQAIKLYEKVLELNPNFAPAYNALGKVYRNSSASVEEVAWYFKSAVEIDPNYIEPYENLGKLYQKANQPDQAEKYLKKVLSLDPNNISTQYALGWLYLTGKSQPDEATTYFKKVLEKNKLPMAYLGLGLSCSKLGDHSMVLDIVTQLKAMGQNELASQLENSIREPLTPSPHEIQVPVSTPPSEIIKAKPPLPEPSPQPVVQGVTPVRLRGKLMNLDPTKPPPKSHQY